jgi:hypothetical protein
MLKINNILGVKIVRRAISRVNIVGRRRRRAEMLARTAVHPSMFGDSLG